MSTRSPVTKAANGGNNSANKATIAITPKPRKLVVSVGTVSVQMTKPTPHEVERNVKAGQDALSRAAKAFTTPGVKLVSLKGVPLYYADPEHPTRLIREVDGKTARGTFAGGKFNPIKTKAKATA